MLDYARLRNGLVVTAFWKAKPHETEAVAAILQRFMPQAQQEPGVRAFMIHQSKTSSPPKTAGHGGLRHGRVRRTEVAVNLCSSGGDRATAKTAALRHR